MPTTFNFKKNKSYQRFRFFLYKIKVKRNRRKMQRAMKELGLNNVLHSALYLICKNLPLDASERIADFIYASGGDLCDAEIDLLDELEKASYDKEEAESDELVE